MLKVLVLPVNVASIGSITVESLNRLQGVAAHGFFINKHKYHYSGHKSYYFAGVSRLKKPINWLVQKAQRFFLFRKLYKEADIVHWIYDDIGLTKSELRFVNKYPKPSVVEWVGSEIRNPNILSSINPYYADAFKNGYEYASYESPSRSKFNQLKFKKLGSHPLVTPEIDLYIDRFLFKSRFFIEHKLFLDEFQPHYPELEKRKPLIVHSPTAIKAKGSDVVMRVINELKEEVDLDFQLLHNMERAEVMKLVKSCDIFIDQLITGMYGLSSAEAMAFGKPVFCYLLDDVRENGLPESCPIVNVSVKTLKDKLKDFISDPMRRHMIGLESRRYAEAHFNAIENAKKLVEVYKKVINGEM